MYQSGKESGRMKVKRKQHENLIYRQTLKIFTYAMHMIWKSSLPSYLSKNTTVPNESRKNLKMHKAFSKEFNQ